MAYRVIEHTADLGFEASAGSLQELFGECLRALTDSVTRLSKVRTAAVKQIRLEAADLPELLVDFLTEAVYLYETEGLVFAGARLDIAEADGNWTLEGELDGEVFELERHGLKTLIKAVTYHQLIVQRRGARWTARVIFDI